MYFWYILSQNCLVEDHTTLTHFKIDNNKNTISETDITPSPRSSLPDAITNILVPPFVASNKNGNNEKNNDKNGFGSSYMIEYQLLENYRPHLVLTLEQTRFSQINRDTLSGVLNIIDKNISSNEREQHNILQQMCNIRDDCIGYSIHCTRGIILYNKGAFPLQYVRNWNFYLKTMKNHEKDDTSQLSTYMDSYNARQNDSKYYHFNEKLGFKQQLLSSDDIPSLSHIWQWKFDKNRIKIANYPYGVPIIPRRFFTFEWNVGRTNNQIYSFEAMLQYCVIYERTVIVPISTHRNHPIGFTSNQDTAIWDFFKLTELCDFVFEYELETLSIMDIPFESNFETMIVENSDKNSDKIINKEYNLEIDMSVNDLLQLKPFINKNTNYFSKDIISDFDELYLNCNDPNFDLTKFLWFREFSLSEQSFTAESRILGNSDGQYTCHVSNGVRDKIEHSKLNECRLLHFTMGRHNHFKLDDFPIYDVLMFMRPSLPYRIAIDQTIIERFERPENYRVGIHRRAMKEGGTDPTTGSPYVCRYVSKSLTKSSRYAGIRNVITNIINKKWDSYFENEMKSNKNKIDNKDDLIMAITDLYDRTCAMNFSVVNDALLFHKQKALWVDNKQKRKERFWIASDMDEADYLLNVWIKQENGITLAGENQLSNFWLTKKYWNKPKYLNENHKQLAQLADKQYIKYVLFYSDNIGRSSLYINKKNADNQAHWWYETSEINHWKQECVVFDMWMLTKSQFFIGTWHSTLTRTVCHWRGWDQMYNSTHCFLQHKWDRLNDKISKGENENIENDLWFDVKTLKKQMLSWERKV